MLKKIEDMNYYELLEVSYRATAQEIHKAYERVRKIYDPNSIALYSLFSHDETEKIRQRVEEAYRTLIYDENRRDYDRTLRDMPELPEAPQPELRYLPRPYAPRPQTPRMAEPLPHATAPEPRADTRPQVSTSGSCVTITPTAPVKSAEARIVTMGFMRRSDTWVRLVAGG